ncbi:MAG TPA: hypothetical protein VHL57_10885, partial [Flavobacteriales bacterium]|nr:hypothetical protein [Flavobacteriales bacterium]
VYSAAYSSTSTPPNNIFEPNTTVYIRAVISDPFGSYDIDPATGGTAPTLTLTDPNGTVQLNAVNMVQVADSGADTKTFEYYSNSPTNTIGYVLGDTVAEGFWTPTVKGFEGTEGTVTHTANGSFELRRPSLTIVKSVSVISDPLGSAKPRAVSGSVSQYSVVVSNGGKGRANGVSISDAIPTNTTYIIGSPSFTDGSTSSGLSAPTYTFFSNAACTTSYSPTGGAGTLDANVKCIKATFTAGTFMNGKTGASSPSFTLTFRVQVN